MNRSDRENLCALDKSVVMEAFQAEGTERCIVREGHRFKEQDISSRGEQRLFEACSSSRNGSRFSLLTALDHLVQQTLFKCADTEEESVSRN